MFRTGYIKIDQAKTISLAKKFRVENQGTFGSYDHDGHLKKAYELSGLDEDAFKGQIEKVLNYVAVRGTKASRGTAGQEMKVSLSVLNIRMNGTSAEAAKGDSVTLSRFAQFYPVELAKILIYSGHTPLGWKSGMLIPFYLCFPGGASLIPAKELGLMKEWLTWSGNFDSEINSKGKKKPNPTRTMKIGMKIWKDERVLNNAQRGAKLEELRDLAQRLGAEAGYLEDKKEMKILEDVGPQISSAASDVASVSSVPPQQKAVKQPKKAPAAKQLQPKSTGSYKVAKGATMLTDQNSEVDMETLAATLLQVDEDVDEEDL
jgi:hypothetical protein